MPQKNLFARLLVRQLYTIHQKGLHLVVAMIFVCVVTYTTSYSLTFYLLVIKVVSTSSNTTATSYTNTPVSYKIPNNTYLAGQNKFTVSELEVFLVKDL